MNSSLLHYRISIYASYSTLRNISVINNSEFLNYNYVKIYVDIDGGYRNLEVKMNP